MNYLLKNSPNSLCHFWNYKSFFTTQLVYITLAQTLHTLDKHIPSKCKFSDFLRLKLKFINFLKSLFKQKVSFSLNFGSLFSVMRDNSIVLSYLKLYMIWTKGTHQFSPKHLKVLKLGFWWDPLIQSRKIIRLNSTEKLCLMTMKNDAKFKDELTCHFKIDRMNLTNFNPSTWKSEEFSF